MALSDLIRSNAFKDRYKIGSGEQVVDAIDSFYIPALRNSISYDREAGYFSSAIFSITYQALPDFIKNGGKIRIICNEYLSAQDIEASKVISSQKKISDDLNEMLQNYNSSVATRLFCTLIQRGILDIKICWKKQMGLFHEKTGIFKDDDGSIITFNGGVNESLGGWLNNNDSITLEQSSGTGRKDVIEGHINDFEELWTNSNKVWQCVPLDDAIKDNIIQQAYDDPSEFESELVNIIRIENSLKDVLSEKNCLSTDDIISIHKSKENMFQLGFVEKMHHQKKALDAWKSNDYKAILKYCTGSGKTMIAMFAIREMLKKKKKPLIIVDGDTLKKQWELEIRKYVSNNIFMPSGEQITEQLKDASKDDGKEIIILANVQSVRSKKFLDNFTFGEHIFLICDECHVLWPAVSNKILQQSWLNCPRLGLSATPEDTTFDDDEKNKNTVDVITFFGGKKLNNHDYEFTETFTIRQAINAKPPVLTKYYYYPLSVSLTETEMENYISLTKKYKKFLFSHDKKNKDDRARLKWYLLERSRIIKNASNKQNKCIEIISSKVFKHHDIDPERQSWLIYVGSGDGNEHDDDRRQIETYQDLLSRSMPGVNVIAYFSDKIKKKDRKKTLDIFSDTQGVIIGCQMLDQGVDIPQLSMGVMLASSKNKRTFIQRRGRLLRQDKSNKLHKKEYAVIFDIIVVPDFNYYNQDSDEDDFLKMVESECQRATDFAEDSINSLESLSELEIIRHKLKARVT